MLTRGQFQQSGAISEGAVQQHGWGPHGSETTAFCNLIMATLHRNCFYWSKKTKMGSTQVFTLNSAKEIKLQLQSYVLTCKNWFNKGLCRRFPKEIWIFPPTRVTSGGHLLGSRRQVYVLPGTSNGFYLVLKSYDGRAG